MEFCRIMNAYIFKISLTQKVFFGVRRNNYPLILGSGASALTSFYPASRTPGSRWGVVNKNAHQVPCLRLHKDTFQTNICHLGHTLWRQTSLCLHPSSTTYAGCVTLGKLCSFSGPQFASSWKYGQEILPPIVVVKIQWDDVLTSWINCLACSKKINVIAIPISRLNIFTGFPPWLVGMSYFQKFCFLLIKVFRATSTLCMETDKPYASLVFQFQVREETAAAPQEVTLHSPWNWPWRQNLYNFGLSKSLVLGLPWWSSG